MTSGKEVQSKHPELYRLTPNEIAHAIVEQMNQWREERSQTVNLDALFIGVDDEMTTLGDAVRAYTHKVGGF